MNETNKRSRKNFKQPRKEGENKAATVNSDKKRVGPGSEAIQAIPLEVKVYNNNFDKALRAFRALVQKERILSTYKEKQSYEKPSDKRRRKRNEMKRKMQEVNNTDYSVKTRSQGKKSFKSRRPQSDASPE
jgi:small subunit ribosomal protein S21